MTLGQRHRTTQQMRRRSFEECAADVIDLRAYMIERQQLRNATIEIPTQTQHAA